MRTRNLFFLLIATALFAPFTHAAEAPPDTVKIGMIGLDTSHSIHFTETLNASDTSSVFADFEVVTAYPKGSLSIKSSYERIPEYTKEMKKMGVEIVDSIDELLQRVDVVMLETNDGRRHLEQVMPVLKAGKPVFVDKPVAASLVDVVAIYEAAEQYDVPIFSSSALRYMENAQAIRHDGKIGEVVGADTYSPAPTEQTHPDLYWYGIHGVEPLFTVMGTGCETVRRVHEEGTDVVTCTWDDGRIGVFRGIRAGERGYGGTAFGTEAIAAMGPYDGYQPLLKHIVEFFRTGEPPVPQTETLEIYAFMTAADESLQRGGTPVPIDEVLGGARRKVEERMTAVSSQQ